MPGRDGGAVVTGVGLVTPIGDRPATFWRSLTEGRSGAAPVRSFDTEGLPNHTGCEVVAFGMEGRVRETVLGGRCTRLAVAAADRALQGSGLEGFEGAHDVAVVVGTTMGEVTRFERDRATHPDDEPSAADVFSLAGRPLDVMARAIALSWSLRGPLVTVPAACAAGTYAVGLAASLVERGRVRAAIAVGCEAFSRLAFVGFSRMRAMSPDVCRPFSKGRPGLLLGEGAGALVIERADEVRQRGGRALARVEGYGMSCDAHHVTGPHPDGAGAARAMVDALRRAGRSPDDVDWVNAHGTGTPLNDRMESLAVREVFGGRRVPLSSIKSLTGHMLGAAGAVEAIASVLALRRATIPPTWNWVEPDPDCDVDCVPNEPRHADLRLVMSNSYAFGGNNATVLLGAVQD